MEGDVVSVVGADTFYMVPRGAIIMWSGSLANVPAGWALCDGSNGTPDLRDRFIFGWTEGVDPGGTGGSSTHSHVMNSHYHSVVLWTDYYWKAEGSWGKAWPEQNVDVAPQPDGGHVGYDEYNNSEWTQNTLAPEGFTGDNCERYQDRLGVKGYTGNAAPATSSANHLPPYYKLAFIMKL